MVRSSRAAGRVYRFWNRRDSHLYSGASENDNKGADPGFALFCPHDDFKYGLSAGGYPLRRHRADSYGGVGLRHRQQRDRRAFRAIKYSYADAIIAGGTEAAINSLAIAGFTNSMALTNTADPDSCSIPFDRRRSGFVMGEGAGVIVLEEYEHAKARGAKIYCELTGYGNTCDAYHITAPAPDASGSSKAIELAFLDAGLEPDEKLYINAHGTSTPLNDKIETMAIKKALGGLAYKIPVSSTKSVTGHMLGAAGSAEAIASIMALKTGVVPPTIGYREPDPECDLDYVPNKARVCEVDKALSLSLGFGGHNAAILFCKI